MLTSGTISVLILVLFFVLGAIIGSFLNVVIYRLHTGKSLNGRSHCLSCGVPLRWYDLVPLFSYIFLRGSCRACAARITPRYFTVELATALSFLLVALSFSDLFHIALHLVIASILIVIVLYDIRHTIIPDELVVLLFVFASIVVIWNPTDNVFFIPPINLLFGALTGAFVYALLWHVSKGRWMGLGDAKLAFPLGMLVGWPAVWSFVILSFWIGAVVSLLTIGILYMRERMRNRGFPSGHIEKNLGYFTMKSEVPFAPFLVAAFASVYLYGVDVFGLTEYLLRTIGI